MDFRRLVAAVVDGDGRTRGSAILISDELLLTAAHVVRTNEPLRVLLLGVGGLVEYTIASTSNDFDIALLRVGSTKGRAPSDFGRQRLSVGGLTLAQLALCVIISAAINAIPFTELGMPAKIQIVINGEYASIPLTVMIIAAMIHYFNQSKH